MQIKEGILADYIRCTRIERNHTCYTTFFERLLQSFNSYTKFSDDKDDRIFYQGIRTAQKRSEIILVGDIIYILIDLEQLNFFQRMNGSIQSECVDAGKLSILTEFIEYAVLHKKYEYLRSLIGLRNKFIQESHKIDHTLSMGLELVQYQVPYLMLHEYGHIEYFRNSQKAKVAKEKFKQIHKLLIVNSSRLKRDAQAAFAAVENVRSSSAMKDLNKQKPEIISLGEDMLVSLEKAGEKTAKLADLYENPPALLAEEIQADLMSIAMGSAQFSTDRSSELEGYLTAITLAIKICQLQQVLYEMAMNLDNLPTFLNKRDHELETTVRSHFVEFALVMEKLELLAGTGVTIGENDYENTHAFIRDINSKSGKFIEETLFSSGFYSELKEALQGKYRSNFDGFDTRIVAETILSKGFDDFGVQLFD